MNRVGHTYMHKASSAVILVVESKCWTIDLDVPSNEGGNWTHHVVMLDKGSTTRPIGTRIRMDELGIRGFVMEIDWTKVEG